MAKSGNHESAEGVQTPVPPNAVRVWRGFQLPTLAPGDFRTALGKIFIPITAQLQSLYGLTAYLPTVLPGKKPAGVPDEIALVFYRTQQAYNDTAEIVAGRAYSSLHKTIFAFPASLSDFPILLGPATMIVDKPYYLFGQSVDWQQGFTQLFVGARPQVTPVQEFVTIVTRFLQLEQKRPAPGLDGAIACVSNNYLVYWEHWENDGQATQGSISELPKFATRVLLQRYKEQKINPSLTAHYDGLKQVEGKSYNITWKG